MEKMEKAKAAAQCSCLWVREEPFSGKTQGRDGAAFLQAVSLQRSTVQKAP